MYHYIGLVLSKEVQAVTIEVMLKLKSQASKLRVLKHSFLMSIVKVLL